MVAILCYITLRGRIKGNQETVNPDTVPLVTKSDTNYAICVTSGTVNPFDV